MVYIISSPSGDKLKIQFDESKPIAKIKVGLQSAAGDDVQKTVSFKKEV